MLACGPPIWVSMLELENLQVFYQKSHVLQGLDLTLRAGEIVSLLGRNGVGRSTAAKAMMGLVPASGSVRFQGQQILGKKPFEISRLGLAYVPETRDVFPGLTVAQNLLLGCQASRPGAWSFADIYQLFPLLAARQHTPAGVLSGGEQQLLSLGRALMGAPQCLLLDEATEGLAPQMVATITECLQGLKQRGIAVLLIEQKLAISLQIADRIDIMARGRIVFSDSPRNLENNPQLAQQYLGF